MIAPKVRFTAIRGLLFVDLAVHPDRRGWFKENWQRATMTAAGLPDFGPVQHNLAFNTATGITRGLHAEPWDKLVSVAHGRVFGAWVDLRPGPDYGSVVTAEIGPDTAVFVPRGVANGYQTLADDTVYSYLVNDHWSADARNSYSYLNLADETTAVPWPIPLAESIVSEADQGHPRLAEVCPMTPRRTLIVGGDGQLGRALRTVLPDAVGVGRAELDVTDPEAVADYPWHGIDTVINAAAYTAVDAAETVEGRRACWAANVTGVANLCRAARDHRLTLVHISSDYVFDGATTPHLEDEPPSPLGVYGQTKAAADMLVSQLSCHYLVRTSWVVGGGRNFVNTMARLAASGHSARVVDDQFGRPTFVSDLAAGIVHLLERGAPPGTYNLSGDGPVVSWYQLAEEVFRLAGRDPGAVTGVSTEAYGFGRSAASRPPSSVLALDKIKAAGFRPANWPDQLRRYLGDELREPV